METLNTTTGGTSVKIRYPITDEFAYVWQPLRSSTVPFESLHTNTGELSLDHELPDVNEFPYFTQNSRRIGRIADWTSGSNALGSESGSKKSSIQSGASYRSGRIVTTSIDGAKNSQDSEAGWEQVSGESRLVQPNSSLGISRDNLGIRKTFAPRPAGQGGSRGGARGSFRGGRGGGGWGTKFGVERSHYRMMDQRKREPSVLVQVDWHLIEEIEFPRLAKLQVDYTDPTPMYSASNVPKFDDATVKNISARNEKQAPLLTERILTHATNPQSYYIPLDQDPLIISAIKNIRKPSDKIVVVSNGCAAALMASQRSVIPWDIVVRKRNGILYLDRRPDSSVEMPTVNETAPADAAPSDNITSENTINTAKMLSAEANALTNYAVPLLLRSPSSACADKNQPDCDTTQQSISTSELGTNCTLLTRFPVIMVDKDQKHPVHIIVLLEYEHRSKASTPASGMDWRLKLDTQRGAVLAHEIRNNGAALSRHVFAAILSGCETIRIAYFSRVSPRDRTRHVLLAVQDFEPLELAAQMNLSVPNGFGVLRALVDLCQSRMEPESDAIIVRDPTKPLLRLYSTPTTLSFSESTNSENFASPDVADVLLLPSTNAAAILSRHLEAIDLDE